MSKDRLQSARDEARIVVSLLNEEVGVEAKIVGTTIVYKRSGKIFHLVVHDMTDFQP